MNIAESIEKISDKFDRAALCFGHGTDNARDEAAWLVLHATGMPLDGSFSDWGRAVNAVEEAEIDRLAEVRCASRKPLAYLLGTAWFAGLEFEVNDQVLVPKGFPKSVEMISAQGYPVIELDVSEFQKLDGGLSCLSLRF